MSHRPSYARLNARNASTGSATAANVRSHRDGSISDCPPQRRCPTPGLDRRRPPVLGPRSCVAARSLEIDSQYSQKCRRRHRGARFPLFSRSNLAVVPVAGPSLVDSQYSQKSPRRFAEFDAAMTGRDFCEYPQHFCDVRTREDESRRKDRRVQALAATSPARGRFLRILRIDLAHRRSAPSPLAEVSIPPALSGPSGSDGRPGTLTSPGRGWCPRAARLCGQVGVDLSRDQDREGRAGDRPPPGRSSGISRPAPLLDLVPVTHKHAQDRQAVSWRNGPGEGSLRWPERERPDLAGRRRSRQGTPGLSTRPSPLRLPNWPGRMPRLPDETYDSDRPPPGQAMWARRPALPAVPSRAPPAGRVAIAVAHGEVGYETSAEGMTAGFRRFPG